jgi:hypothetical protein
MHLTYPNSDPHTGTASTADAGEAGAPEVEITPEMIAAGAEAYLLRDAESLEAPEKTAFSIYLAMEEVRKRTNCTVGQS